MTTTDSQQDSTRGDRRRETRLDEQAMVFIECLASDPASGESGSIELCRAIDVSTSGMQVLMDQPVLIGSILRLCSHFRDADDDMFLVGEVRWVRETDDGCWVGFQLYDSEQTDFLTWQETLAGKLTSARS